MPTFEITYADDRPTETIEADHLDFVVIDADWEWVPDNEPTPRIRVDNHFEWGNPEIPVYRVRIPPAEWGDPKHEKHRVYAPAQKIGKQIAYLDRALDADGTVVWEAERHTIATITEQAE